MAEILLRPAELGYRAIVDDEDYRRLAGYVWYAKVKPRRLDGAFRWRTDCNAAHRVGLHEEVMQFKSGGGLVIDHINCNPLDNRKENLRVCTAQQNVWNRRPNRCKQSSKYKCIGYAASRSRGIRNRSCKPWHLTVNKEGKTKYCGRFADEYDAYLESQKKLKEFHGEFAHLVPWSGYSNPKYPNKPMNYRPPETLDGQPVKPPDGINKQTR